MDEIKKSGESEKVLSGSKGLLIIIGWICAIVSLWAYPFIFGVIGVIMGILVAKNGSRSGVTLIVSSIILMGIGMVFSGVIMNYTRHFLGG